MPKQLNLYKYKGFKLLKTDTSREAKRLHAFCLINNIPLLRVDNTNTHDIIEKQKEEENYVPCGSVEWCEKLLGYRVTPNYYPEWAQSLLHRKVWQGDRWLLQKVFVKPADRYKRFTGFVTTGTYKKKKKPPFYFSEVVQFENEWRCYVTHGRIIAWGWYWGDEISTPDLHITQQDYIQFLIPYNYSGALDIGEDSKGTLMLIESQHPFACGWYGEQVDDYKYFQWLIDGWEYMKDEG